MYNTRYYTIDRVSFRNHTNQTRVFLAHIELVEICRVRFLSILSFLLVFGGLALLPFAVAASRWEHLVAVVASAAVSLALGFFVVHLNSRFVTLKLHLRSGRIVKLELAPSEARQLDQVIADAIAET